jgi:glycosyltransferase involved in cell wall biosynthesis
MSILPTVSIVIPTYNEERDIRATIEALLRLNYPDIEVIIVDDSTDETPTIIREYAARGVRMLRQKTPEGRCGARNLGIRNASGEIIVVLNADVLLPPDFILHILSHYREGADYVLVKSLVANPQSVYARFIEAEGRYCYDNSDAIEWTEGFSCRREAILAAGLFPVGYPTPMHAGEDGHVGQQLNKLGYKKVIDRSIVVRHFAPSRLGAFWAQQVGRGFGIIESKLYLEKRSWQMVLLRLIAKSLWLLARVILLFPSTFRAYRLSQHSPRGVRDLLPFTYVLTIQIVAQRLGEWLAFLRIVSKGWSG